MRKILLATAVSAVTTTDVSITTDPSHLFENPTGPNSPICRIHTDVSDVEPYNWRKAFTPTTHGEYDTHSYGVCAHGRGPWKFAASNLSVSECTAKCTELNCTCFDYFCNYHEAADCACPHVPPVTPLATAKKVACVGDSITAGYLSSCGLNYPNQLQALLGDKYAVTNYGVGGRTLLKHADAPYWNTSQFVQATTSNADIVVIMLGTNDAKKQNWEHLHNQYSSDYADLIEAFNQMASNPTILIMTPPPLYRDGRYGMLQTAINSDLPRLVPTVAKTARLAPPVDLFGLYEAHCPIASGTPGHAPNATDEPCSWIGCGGVDACHPDNVGYGKVAAAVRDAILSRLG